VFAPLSLSAFCATVCMRTQHAPAHARATACTCIRTSALARHGPELPHNLSLASTGLRCEHRFALALRMPELCTPLRSCTTVQIFKTSQLPTWPHPCTPGMPELRTPQRSGEADTRAALVTFPPAHSGVHTS